MLDHSTTTRHNVAPSEEFFDALIRLVTVWRVELLLALPPVALGGWLYFRLGPVGAGVIVGLLVLSTVLVPRSRHLLGWVLHRASVRRQLDTAFTSVTGVLGERPPIVLKVARTNGGDRVDLGLRHGTSLEELERATAIVTASLGVRAMHMAVDPARQNHVTLSIVRRDPFETTSLRCPMLDASRFDAWEPIPVGVDEESEVVTVSLPEHNVLFGAEPGGGKSVALSVLVACVFR